MPQELLLQAALLDGAAALAAWRQWRARVDPEPLDYDSYRLLPLLYRALQKHGISDSEMGRFKGVYRRTWYDNALRLNQGVAILDGLHHAGIKTMVFNGAALALRYYREAGLRPMDDFDIVVPSHQGPAAIDVLRRSGWTPLPKSVGIAYAEEPAIGRVYPFRNARGQEVTLHQHVFCQRVHPSADGELWTAARPIVLAGVPTQILSPADQLLHVCVQGTEGACRDGAGRPGFGWVADAVMILRNAPEELDWGRLLAQARRLQFLFQVREALGYLHDLLGTEIPAPTLARIVAVPVPLAERIAARARACPPGRWGPSVALAVQYVEYCSTLPPDAGLIRRLAGLPAFFQRRWGSVSPWHVPFQAVFRTLRRTWWMMHGVRAQT